MILGRFLTHLERQIFDTISLETLFLQKYWFLDPFFVPKFGYILIRFKSFFDPTSGNNYQSEKASEAIISGGFFGKGIGEGVLKNRVPEAHTDYIVSVIFKLILIILLNPVLRGLMLKY